MNGGKRTLIVVEQIASNVWEWSVSVGGEHVGGGYAATEDAALNDARIFAGAAS